MAETRSLLVLRSGSWRVAAAPLGIEFLERSDEPAQPLSKLLGSAAVGGTRLLRAGDVTIAVETIDVAEVPVEHVRPLPWLLARRDAQGWRGLVRLPDGEVVVLIDLWSMV